MSQVNLLPPEIVRGQKTRRTAVMVLAAGGVVLALLFGFYLLQGKRLASVEDEIAAQVQTNDAIAADIADLQKFEELQVKAQQQQQLLQAAYAGEVAFSGLLMDVSTVIPTESYLQSLSASVEAPSAEEPTDEADAGATFVGNLTMNGEAIGIATVSQLLTRLEQVDGWVNPWVSSTTQAEASLDSWTWGVSVDLTEAVVTERGKTGETTDG